MLRVGPAQSRWGPAIWLQVACRRNTENDRDEGKSLSFLEWLALGGVVLLLMALSSAFVRRLPISTSIIYLVLGIGIGPAGAGWVAIDLVRGNDWVEHAAEIAVIVSLFAGGLKLRLPPSDPAWVAARRLAIPTMLATIMAVAALTHFLLGVDLATALLVGAVLAPTDPVLASAVAVEDAADHDRMRYGLSGEAGLNDGMAFPFVILALDWGSFGTAGPWLAEWVMRELLWAIPAALMLGFYMGKWVGRLAIALRSRERDIAAPSDFLVLALIALSYVGGELVNAWGFLSVFAAGVGLRQAEVHVVAESPHPAHQRPALWRRLAPRPPSGGESMHPPAEHMVRTPILAESMKEPSVAAGVLVAEAISFGATLERLLEVLLVVLIGVTVADLWQWRGVVVALALLFVIRPLAVHAFLAGSPTTAAQRWLMGWFGVRGIGSVFYLTYAIGRGVSGEAAHFLASTTVTVIALSILLHGASAQPILDRYRKRLARE